jgi:hypothetical protein
MAMPALTLSSPELSVPSQILPCTATYPAWIVWMPAPVFSAQTLLATVAKESWMTPVGCWFSPRVDGSMVMPPETLARQMLFATTYRFDIGWPSSGEVPTPPDATIPQRAFSLTTLLTMA